MKTTTKHVSTSEKSDVATVGSMTSFAMLNGADFNNLITKKYFDK